MTCAVLARLVLATTLVGMVLLCMVVLSLRQIGPNRGREKDRDKDSETDCTHPSMTCTVDKHILHTAAHIHEFTH